MEVIENKALKLRLRNPHRVLEVIPKSVIVGEHDDGTSDVLVHWSLEAAQVLKNLKIKNVPSPISTKYKWPGTRDPFTHQKQTSAFLTLNRRAFVFSDPGCVDSETEYLSPTGWKKLSEYTEGQVAQYWPEKNSFEFVDPDEYVKLPCDEMVRIKTQYGLDQLLSPEHRVLLTDKAGCKLETTNALAVLDRHDAYHEGYKARAGGTKVGTDTIAFSHACIPTAFNGCAGKGIDLTNAQLRLMVAVMADGYFPNISNTCVIRLKKPRKIERLDMLLTEAGIAYRVVDCLPEGFKRYSFTAPRKDKHYTEHYWDADIRQLQVIADEVMHWDGCVTRGARFSTSVKASADFIQYVYFSLNKTARMATRVRNRRGREETEYTVQVRPQTRLGMRSAGTKTVSTASSTDGFKYCFMVPSTYLLFRRNGCVFASGNTGKTLSIIWAADYLMQIKAIKRVLVICPVSVMRAAWVEDLFHGAMHRRVDIAHGTREQRIRAINGDAEFVVINFDGVAIVRKELMEANFDVVVIDEANYVKTATTDRWGAINKLIRPDTWLWMVTGTPASQSPTDAYGLVKMMHPSTAPRSFGMFRDSVMTKVTTFKWLPKLTAVSTVNTLLQPAIRYTKDECLDLPDIMYTTRDVPLTRQQQKLYNDIKQKLATQVAGETITAVHAAAGLNKLLQVSAGAVYTDDHATVELDISERYKVLREVIDATDNKVIVFVPYTNTLEALREKLTASKYAVDVIYGAVSANKRAAIIKQFQEQPDPKILVIQPQAASHGITLHAADTIVWWGPIMSYETYVQANARIHRAGQKNKCLIVRLQGSPVEMQRYKALDKCEDTNVSLLEMFEEVLTM